MALLKKIALSFLSLLVYISIGEVGLFLTGQQVLSNEIESFWPRNSPLLNRCENDPYDHTDFHKRFWQHNEKEKRHLLFLGGSSVAGEPHGYEDSFPKYVQKILKNQNSNQYIINGGSSCKDSDYIKRSYDTVKDSPHLDYIIIYAGHNDVINLGLRDTPRAIFLKNNPIFRKMQIFLEDNSYLYSYIRLKIYDIFSQEKFNPSDRNLEDINENKKLLTKFYKNNIRYVIKEAKKRGQKVLLITQTSNLLDYNVDKLDTPFDRSFNALQVGRQLFGQKKFTQALKMLIEAKDHDPVPNRVISEINNATRALSKEESVGLLDLEKITHDKYLKIGIGCNLFGDETYCDHLHPNRFYKRWIAELVVAKITEMEKIPTRKLSQE